MGESFEVASEIEHLAARIIDRNTRDRFLKGFETAIKDSQEKNSAKPMHEHLKKGLDDPYNFGVHLGYLIGFLRFHPRQILESHETANHFLESINHLKAFNDFHSFAKEKLQSWNRKIRPNFKQLEETEKRVYMTVMRMI